MKKLLFAIMATLCIGTVAYAKTENIEIMPTESIVYTLEEDDSLNVDLIVDEKGLFYLELVSMTTTGDFPCDIELTLTDGSNTLAEFRTEDGFVEKRYLILKGLDEGEYVIKIKNLTFFGDVSFEISTSFENKEYIENSVSDSFENATPMKRAKKYHGGVYGRKTFDYYSFEMPYDGYAYLQMYSPSLKYFTLYDENKNKIGVVDAEIEDTEKVYEQRIGLAKGNYYISVNPKRDYTSPEYTLEVITHPDDGFESEYNNTPETADELEFGKEYKANLFGIDDDDVFSFEISKKSDVKIKLFDTYYNAEGHYDFRLYDKDGKTLLKDEKLNSKNCELQLDEGKYFIEITSPGEEYFTSLGYIISVNVKVLEEAESEDSKTNEENNQEDKPEERVQFSDISNNDWFAEEILAARNKGLVDGMGDDKFYPEKAVSLAEAIAMAVRLKYPEINHENLDENEKWYSPYVRKAVETELIKEDDFNDFEIEATRAQTAYIFSGFLSDDVADKEINVPDVDENTEFHESIYKLYRYEILKGNDGKGTFYPEKNISRAEAVVILLRVSLNI